MSSQSLRDKFYNLKSVYLMEKRREDSFKKWPYDESSKCSISKMAEAGFYWSGTSMDDDTVTCFVCGKQLYGWEPTDDPWKEHAKYAPQCQFVKYGHKEKDMTMEEFLNIFYEVGMNKLTSAMNTVKLNFVKMAKSELEQYRLEK